MARRNRYEGTRLTTLFAATGGVLWLVAGLFIGWAFGTQPAPGDWVLMHQEKLQVAVGVGLAGIGSLFLCFAALIAVVATERGEL